MCSVFHRHQSYYTIFFEIGLSQSHLALDGGLRWPKVVVCAILALWEHGNVRINACGDRREQNKHPVDVCSAPTGMRRRNEVDETGSPLALDNGYFTSCPSLVS